MSMGKVLLISTGCLSLYLAYVFYVIFSDGQPPELPDFYWGPKGKEKEKEDTSIRPFKINIDEKVLIDLKTRLKLEVSAEGNRLTPPLEGIGFEYGFNTNFLKTVTTHWLNKYDWRAREKALNKYPHFKTSISGIDIHFQHVKSLSKKQYKQTRPLLLLHGWPGSFVEFQQVIPLLIDPENSDINFELVIPSLPGFGFSEHAHRPGLGPVEAAQLFLKLMKRIGHETFYVQGGDWGSFIGANMATLYPQNVVAFHSNMCVSLHPRVTLRILIGSLWPSLFVDDSDMQIMYPLSKFLRALFKEMKYFHVLATKPDTIGIGVSNSPSALAAYILEKFASGTNILFEKEENGGLLEYYELDELLDNLMIYWVTNSFTTSVRFYSEAVSRQTLAWGMGNVPVNVPTGCLYLANDVFSMLSEWHIQDKFPKVISFIRGSHGGHFAAFELPYIFSIDLINYFNSVERNYATSFQVNAKKST